MQLYSLGEQLQLELDQQNGDLFFASDEFRHYLFLKDDFKRFKSRSFFRFLYIILISKLWLAVLETVEWKMSVKNLNVR